MKEYIFQNMMPKDRFPYVEFEIKIKAENDKDAWLKLKKLLELADVSSCKMIETLAGKYNIKRS